MELGLIDKMKIIFQSLFSSFMFIEIFLFFFLLFLLVVFNLKIKNKVVPIALSIFAIISIFVFIFSFSSYALTCIDSFIMKVMDYYYFPSTIVFFFLFVLSIFIFIYTLFSKKLATFKKVFNYFCMSFIFLLFSMFVSFAVIGQMDLADPVALYQNEQILAVVQFSNLIFLLWIVVTFFYHLFMFFKRKFDNEKVEN